MDHNTSPETAPTSRDAHSTAEPPANGAACRPRAFYDGSCPLCRREIAFYRRQDGADAIEWVDVSVARGDVAPGLSRDDAMRRFHVARADGTLVSGARAFTELWTSMPRFAWMTRLSRLPLVTPLLELAYRGFLPVRPYLQRLARRRDG